MPSLMRGSACPFAKCFQVFCAAAPIGLAMPSISVADTAPRFTVELEAGGVWQSRNDVEIPNDGTATRFSLKDLVGRGPWPAGRLYLTYDISSRHSLRGLAAPLSYTETGNFEGPVRFAGAEYAPGLPTEATYQFNSWRLGYRFTFVRNEHWTWRVGLTAKIRDARIELAQGSTTSKDTDVGFVPLLHVSGDWRFSGSWRLLLDVEALGGGPGRAEDASLKIGHDVSSKVMVTAGYRIVEGGADVDEVYNFAWFHYAVVSGAFRF